MTTTATADLRWSRAVVTAAVALAIGSIAHASAGGLLPGPVGMLVIGATLTVLFAAALGRPASYALVALLVCGGQALVHVVLTGLSGHPGPHGAGEPLADPDESAAPSSLGHWAEHLRDDLSGPHLVMALAHLGAAAVVAAWLFVGEQALWALIALLGTALVRRMLTTMRVVHACSRLVLTRPVPPSLGVVADTAPRLSSRLVSAGPQVRRGPPAGHAPVLLALLLTPTS